MNIVFQNITTEFKNMEFTFNESLYSNKKARIEKMLLDIKTCDENHIEKNIKKIIKFISISHCVNKRDNQQIPYYDSIVANLLNEYDDYISDFAKFEILLHIKNETIFLNYAKKHQKKFEEIAEKVILCSADLENEFDDLNDVQYYLDNKYGIGTYRVIDMDVSIKDNSYNIFNFFCSEIKFIRYGSFAFYHIPFEYMSFKELKKLLLKEKNNGKYIEEISKAIFHKLQISNVKVDDIYELLNDEKIQDNLASNLLKCIFEENKIFLLEVDSHELKKEYKIIIDYVDSSIDGIDTIDSFGDINFLKALKFFSTIDPKERNNSPLYLRCFQLFLEKKSQNFDSRLENEDVIILSNLFHRSIDRGILTLKEILTINNKNTLYHYYKTNELIFDLPYTLEQIKNYNAKQYFSLQKYYENNRTFDKKKLLLQMLIYFGYDYSKKSNLLTYKNCEDLIKYASRKNDDEIAKLKTFLEENFSILDDKNYPMDSIIGVYEYLSNKDGIKLTQSKLKKCIDSFEYTLLPNNMHIGNNLLKLNLVSKGEPLLEKVAGIVLYNEYRFRLLSSIPDINGGFEDYSFQMVDLHDPNIISNGIGNYILPNEKVASSCLTPNGKAASCLRHGANDINGRFFKITKQDEIMAYSWVWRCGDVLCFDNIEITKEFIDDSNYEKKLFEIYKKVSNEIIETTKKMENRGVRLVVVGRNPIDVQVSYLEQLPKVNDYTSKLFKPNCTEELYLKDSEQTQIILAGSYDKDLNLSDVEPIYKYKRKETNKFSDLDRESLKRKINAIYFDYCIDNNIKYKELSINDYVDGYINEDWFVGIRKDKNRDFFYIGKDNRLFLEAKKYNDKDCEINSHFVVHRPFDEQINSLFDLHNYEIDSERISEYLKTIESEKCDFDGKYLHGASDLKTIASILLDNSITSSYCSNRSTFGLNNGKYFISVAKKEPKISLEKSCIYLPSFVLDENICAFSTWVDTIPDGISKKFANTSYPIRPNLRTNEYQVLNCISLDRASAIAVSDKHLYDLSQIIMLQDYLENNLPLVCAQSEQIIDKEIIKKYIKFK